MFDAAHAFGCTYKGRMIGTLGDAEVYSFHATKFLNSFEGGALATNDDELARRARFMRNFGFAGYDQVDFIGINAKMSEICAAMGVTSLESMDNVVAVNRANYLAYRDGLADLPGVELYAYDIDAPHNYQYIIVMIDPQTARIDRDKLVRILQAENVIARRYFHPGVHQMEPYRSHFPHAGLLLPETNRLTERVLSLPNGTAVTPDDIAVICDILRLTITSADRSLLEGITS